MLSGDFPLFDLVEILIPAIMTGSSVLMVDNLDIPQLSKWFEDTLHPLAPGLA